MADAILGIVYDAQSLLGTIFGIVEFLLGISYVGGKCLTGCTIEAFSVCGKLVSEARVFFELIHQFLSDFVQNFLEAVFFFYYASGHIADAFCITFRDLAEFIQHVLVTIGLLIESCFNLIFGYVTWLVFVPVQVCGALSLIGDFCLGFAGFLNNAIFNAGRILFFTPLTLIQVLQTISKCIVEIPPKILNSIPLSAHVGFFVIAIAYFIYCRLSFRLFIRSTVSFCRRTLAFCRALKNIFQFKPTVTQAAKDLSKSGIEKPEGSRDTNGVCVLCFENPVTYLASPCNHICVCKDCCYELVRNDNRCPLCRKLVKSYTRVYIS